MTPTHAIDRLNTLMISWAQNKDGWQILPRPNDDGVEALYASERTFDMELARFGRLFGSLSLLARYDISGVPP